MKELKSVILLFAFLVGAIQPVVPLLEYHFFKESIIELFCENRNVPESDCDGICYLTNQIEENRETQNERQTGHVDYYPGFVFLGQSVNLNIYPEKNSWPDFSSLKASIFSTVHTPPPRIS